MNITYLLAHKGLHCGTHTGPRPPESDYFTVYGLQTPILDSLCRHGGLSTPAPDAVPTPPRKPTAPQKRKTAGNSEAKKLYTCGRCKGEWEAAAEGSKVSSCPYCGASQRVLIGTVTVDRSTGEVVEK